MITKMAKKMFPAIISLRRDFINFFHRHDMELHRSIFQRQQNHPNPFVKYGKKCYSQADEDGLTIEIIKRLNIENGTFAEFGVGDGTENNTLVLLAMGWKGFWIGGEDLLFDAKKSSRLAYYKAWVTLDNVRSLYFDGAKKIGVDGVDVVSLDLDGNDLYFCDELLSGGVRPHLFIVEYNAKFLPPIRFSIQYDERHVWQNDDYQGASLASFVDVFAKYGYRLICCNAATGVNAFFVRDESAALFLDVPEDIASIYAEPHYHLFKQYGHKKSVRTIEEIIR